MQCHVMWIWHGRLRAGNAMNFKDECQDPQLLPMTKHVHLPFINWVANMPHPTLKTEDNRVRGNWSEVALASKEKIILRAFIPLKLDTTSINKQSMIKLLFNHIQIKNKWTMNWSVKWMQYTSEVSDWGSNQARHCTKSWMPTLTTEDWWYRRQPA